MLANVLHALTSPPGSRLRHVALQTGTKQYMGPFVVPDLVHKINPIELPFREDSPRLPFPVFYYALEDLVSYHSEKHITWSVQRSSIILGASSRSIYNSLLTLAAYALICRHEGQPFLFPGTRFTWEHFCDASDAGLLAEQQVWAATTEAAKNQAFNCTNGDVFTWRSIWRALAEELGLEFVEFSEDVDNSDWAQRMRGKAAVWDAIVEENGLYKTRLEEITCFEALHAVLNFRFQHVSSVNKSREFGFLAWVNTIKSVRKWVGRLREMKIIV